MTGSLRHPSLALFLAASPLIFLSCASQRRPAVPSSATAPECPRSAGELVYNDVTPDSGGRRNMDIYAICTDGSGRRRLTSRTGYDGAPLWSPDGRQIAFISDRDGGPRPGGVPATYLYVMNADGTDVRRIIDRFVGNFSWSPDGRRVAFISIPAVTSEDSADVNRWIAKRDVFVVNVDGSGLLNLTNSPGPENFPAWSPDGREIAFGWQGQMGDRAAGLPARNDDEDWSEIYVMHSDGSNARRLTFNRLGVGNGCCEDTAPRWSRDNRWIAFITKRDANSEIYRMRRDGSDQQRLTHNTTFDGYPAWSVDGRHVVFNKHVAAVRDGPGRTPDSLYVMNADGSERRSLGISGSRPDWRPR